MKFPRILFISNLFPNILEPNRAPYNRQQILALSKYFHIDVISPVPWRRYQLKKRLAYRQVTKTVHTYHPPYFYTPKIFRSLYGLYFLFSIWSCANRLLNTYTYERIFASWLFPDAWAASVLAKKYALPLYVKVHGTDVNRLRKGSLITTYSLSTVHNSVAVVCVSKALRDKLILLGAADYDKLHVIYNGVDKKIFCPAPNKERLKRELKIDPGCLALLFVGNLKKEKGVFELLQMYYYLKIEGYDKSIKLYIIGEGRCKKKLEQMATCLGVENDVMLLGSLPSSDVAKWMQSCDILCLPSYMEGVPNVVLEALSCGMLCVASRVGGIPEIVSDRIELVEPGSVTSLLAGVNASIERLNRPQPTVDAFTVPSWEENARMLYRIFNTRPHG